MKNERYFWGALLAVSVLFICLSTYFFLAVIFPYHLEQMKSRARESINNLQIVMPYLDTTSRQSYLEKLSQKTEDLSYLLLMDTHGTALAHSNPQRVGMQFDEAGLHRALASGKRIEQIYVRDADNPSSPYHGEKTIDIIEPFFLADGTLAGAVNVGVSLAAVERIKIYYLLFSGVVSILWLLLVSGFALFQLRTMDIRRKAVAALQASELRLSHAIAATSDAIWEYDLAKMKLTYSTRLNEMLGISETEGTWSLEQWAALCHPDDIEQVRKTIHTALVVHDKMKYEVEFRMRHASGHWQWMQGRGNIVEVGESGNSRLLSGTIVDINERKLQEELLRESEARYRGIIDNMQDGYYRTDKEGRLIFVSPSVPRQLGYDRAEEILGRFNESFWAKPEERTAMIERLNSEGKVCDYEVQLRRKDGAIINVATSSAYYLDQTTGEISGIEGVIRDIGERKVMQEQLLQAQKMEAVGRLAGGVAHDFNNMLSVIIGRTELALLRFAPDPPLQEYLLEIQNAAERSAKLTRQLLAFARKQTYEPKVVDICKEVSRILQMNQRLIREDIAIEWLPAPDALHIMIDPSQLDQIVTNLCVNASDAIIGSGKITVAASRITLGPQFCARHEGLATGEYASLSIGDTGCGMDKEVLDHIFEPFFTTKNSSNGTGLGLATVFGIVRQNQGVIEAQSTPDKGSVFTLYLPLFEGIVNKEAGGKKLAQVHGQGETILLVEDDAAVVSLATLMLEQLHYNVLAVSSPDEALEIALRHPGSIDLLLTDVIMPNMNGRELANRIQAIRPQIQCLFMSGYTADVISKRGIIDKEVHFIHKPLTMQALADKIYEVLHSQTTTSS